MQEKEYKRFVGKLKDIESRLYNERNFTIEDAVYLITHINKLRELLDYDRKTRQMAEKMLWEAEEKLAKEKNRNGRLEDGTWH